MLATSPVPTPLTGKHLTLWLGTSLLASTSPFMNRLCLEGQRAVSVSVFPKFARNQANISRMLWLVHMLYKILGVHHPIYAVSSTAHLPCSPGLLAPLAVLPKPCPNLCGPPATISQNSSMKPGCSRSDRPTAFSPCLSQLLI